MLPQHTMPTDFMEVPPQVSEFRRFIRVLCSRGVVVFGIIVILATITSAIFAPIIAPYDPYDIDMSQTLVQPCWEHPLGTDVLGRDTLSRIIYGTRISLMVGVTAVFISASVGMTLGLAAGYFGGITYMVIMRLIDALMSFPMLLKALTIAALLGPGLRNIIIALGISLLAAYARLMCAQVLSVKGNEYVTAGRVIGASNLRIMLRHIIPNSFPPLLVLVTMMMGTAILTEASLSFLGIGIEPPAAAWGSMVSDGRRYLLTHPLLSFSPGLAIMLVVFAFNMVGDGLRDTLDPRLRGIL